MIMGLITLVSSVVSQPAYDTVVVCPAEFSSGLGALVEHREQQGHRLAIVSI